MKFKQPLNILLADDDKDDRIFFEKALKEIPIATHLTTVHDGEKLMDYLEKNIEHHLPDVLFLDLAMPRKSGYECLVEIKENEKLKGLHVIVFSTSITIDRNYEQNMINTLCKFGAYDYIRKHSDFEKIKQVLHDALIKMLEIRKQEL